MTHPMTTSIKSRGLSRRDHVLNLLPPLTVVNKEDATMHDRLFSDNPPPKTYPENFPSKVLRHLGAWTFYSAPTKGELALLDKNMYDLENEEEIPEKTDAEGKKYSSHTENLKEHGTLYHKHTPRIQSHCASDDKKRLEPRKGKTLKMNKEKQIQQVNEEEKVLPQKEGMIEDTEQQKPSLTPESTQRGSSVPNLIEKAKQQESGNKSKNVETTKKVTKRHSHVTRTAKKLQKNTQVKGRPQAPLAKVEITLKKSRGKVLGGAETGTEISAVPLTVEGHNMSVPGHDRHNGTHDVERAGDHKETIKLNTTERKDSRVSKRNRSSSCDTCSADFDKNYNEKTTASDETQVKRSVIKIPLQENDSSEEADNNSAITPGCPTENPRAITPGAPTEDLGAITPNTDDTKSQNKVDSLESPCASLRSNPIQEQCENAMKPEVSRSSENLCSNLEDNILRDKRVTFDASFEKEPVNETKRARSQNGHKKERKRSGKNRVKSG